MAEMRHMRIFVNVCAARSFTGAAQKLGLHAGVVSRSISELEVALKTRLIQRTTRRLSLTDAGEKYFARCREILRLAELADQEALHASTKPIGRLKVHAPPVFGKQYVVPVCSRYLEDNPDVQIDLTLSPDAIEPVGSAFDVVICFSQTALPDSGLVAVKLFDTATVLCASPGYLQKTGTPETLASLHAHVVLQLIEGSRGDVRWVIHNSGREETFDLERSRIRVSCMDALSASIQEGLGIGALPWITAKPLVEAGTLVRILPNTTMNDFTAYALYPSREYLDAKTSRWIRLLQEHIREVTKTAEDESSNATPPSARLDPSRGSSTRTSEVPSFNWKDCGQRILEPTCSSSSC
ncbi:LysR family transcriptional regulator [Caballeronia sp. LZ043]|uniref:LysR family transcriptional regulator n=1 Tax=Caballeronia sp. LZ043 TaxID=3038569 RepID=UPI00285BBD40|nr:LysR family transcriptional regulator [Caballeronia sp. LZ043]MDR5823623.1 LysR family transcriptional regulator [Caballeronia sp. LZ043]